MISPALISLAALLEAAPPAPRADPAELRATLTALVGFGTRHSLSSSEDPKRGIDAARRWAAARFEEIGKACAGCLEVENVSDQFTVPRAPNGVTIVDVLAIQRGTTEPDRVIILSAHIDSRASDVMDAKGDAPGANDDGSGVAAVIEAARLLSREKYPATLVYALLSGEEQGLLGGRLLAATAKARGWQVTGVLNNDIVGNTHGQGGERVTDRVRVFSEGLPSSEDLDGARARRSAGGEDDSPSRALARFVDGVADREKVGLDVWALRRPDRFARGGDHLPMLEAGHPAVRITEAVENYDRQHQDIRVEKGVHYGDLIDGVDFPYLARVSTLNAAVARALARAPAAPAKVELKGALSPDTTVSWAPVPGATAYRVWWRRADGHAWTMSQRTPETRLTLPHVVVDDHFFGVASVAADGSESLITFAATAAR